MEFMLFWAAFGQVFFLGFNSKLLRDDKIFAGFCVSWMITVTQFGMVWAVAHAGLSVPMYLLIAGAGGSIGITSAQYFYKWYDKKFHKERT